MKMLIPTILKLVQRQTSIFFLPQDSENQESIESQDIEIALLSFQKCISALNGKYYSTHLSLQDFYISDKYAVFLYYLSRALYSADKSICATQIYSLNKILHSLDAFYEVDLPEIFMLTHPVGSVLGRAKYSNYFCAYHNCGVGSDKKDGITHYPSFGEGVVLYGGAKVIGKCQVGDNVIFGANAFIIHTNVPSNSVVVGAYPNHRILPSPHNVLNKVFGVSSQHKGG